LRIPRWSESADQIAQLAATADRLTLEAGRGRLQSGAWARGDANLLTVGRGLRVALAARAFPFEATPVDSSSDSE
jgi:hypothetical protein